MADIVSPAPAADQPDDERARLEAAELAAHHHAISAARAIGVDDGSVVRAILPKPEAPRERK